MIAEVGGQASNPPCGLGRHAPCTVAAASQPACHLPSHLQRGLVRLQGEAATQALPVLQAAGDDQPAIAAAGGRPARRSNWFRCRALQALAALVIRRRHRWQGEAVGAALRHEGHQRLAAALGARIRPMEGSRTASWGRAIRSRSELAGRLANGKRAVGGACRCSCLNRGTQLGRQGV